MTTATEGLRAGNLLLVTVTLPVPGFCILLRIQDCLQRSVRLQHRVQRSAQPLVCLRQPYVDWGICGTSISRFVRKNEVYNAFSGCYVTILMGAKYPDKKLLGTWGAALAAAETLPYICIHEGQRSVSSVQ